ncbi:MAG: hypothetical protein A4S12_13925 [Proteobacteria bacterium SG_bin5]|nr:hypothetical protein [Sphingomonas sp.]OQW43457.1 MAG: hypothetical protein A4S12_13925 [Proteobacteria bacterium SG_bin5]
MADEQSEYKIHSVKFTFIDLAVSNDIQIEISEYCDASVATMIEYPVFELGAAFQTAALSVSELVLRPRRIYFTVANPPARLPMQLRIMTRAPIIFGRLHVPDKAQTEIATMIERVRLMGPGYWAVPVLPPAGAAARAAPPPSRAADDSA